MKKYFEDCFGSKANIAELRSGFRLTMTNHRGVVFYNRIHKTEASCRREMNWYTDGRMQEVTDTMKNNEEKNKTGVSRRNLHPAL